MFNISKYKILMVLISLLVSSLLFSQNTSCQTATLFVDNNCVFITPPLASVTRCFSFISPEDSVDFDFVSFATFGSCVDGVASLTLYDANCDSITSDTSGVFINLTPNAEYKICYTATCPTSGFINLICSSETIILPIELLYFNARVEYNNIRLLWETATERDNMLFMIYKSNDFINWYNIGSVEGSGSSILPISYSFLYEEPTNGVNYFRLEQIDFDGKKTTFDVIAVEFILKNKPTNIFEKYNMLGQKTKTN